MRIHLPNSTATGVHRRVARNPRERGLAVIAVLVIILIMTSLAVSNSRTLSQLKRELQRVEKKQLERLHRQAVTNPPPKVPQLEMPSEQNPR